MSKKLAVRTSVLVLLVAVVAFTAACPAKDAAVAVNKYANSLSALQDGEITVYDAGKVDPKFHIMFQKSLKIAKGAGAALDQCILLANKGGDSGPCIASAQHAYDELVSVVAMSNQQDLVLLGQAAGAALQNAISLVQSIHPTKPAPTSAFWLGFGLLGMASLSAGVGAAGGLSLASAAQLLTLVVGLEPVAFQLLLQLAQSLKDKSVEEVVAMSEKIFGKIDATADAEIAKAEAKISEAPTPTAQE